jgi:prepilin-type N-terminal cleavage/methylation domain-containing protein
LKRGFSLLELLVVIAIVGMLSAVLLPVLAKAKDAGKKAVSLNNIKQITLANFLYLDDNDDSIAPNRDCQIFLGPNAPSASVPCRVGRAMRGWIDLTVPYVKSYQVFKSPADPTEPVRLPANSIDFDGRPIQDGIIWAPRPNGENLGGEFRSSYARNNNFANNGTYTASSSAAQFPSHTILIYSFAPNSGGGASGNEGTPGASFTIVRRSDVFPEPGSCLAYNPKSTGNSRSNFIELLPASVQNQEGQAPSSERYFGSGIYSFLDGHARTYRPERIRGQCNWGNRPGGVEFGNDGTTPDFRF